MIRKLNDDGVLNLAAAVMTEAINTYLNAKHMYNATRDPVAKRRYDDTRNFILTTPWNVTGLTGLELLRLIDETEDKITIEERREFA